MNAAPTQEHPQHLWDQFIRLGDMMGDGRHHEPGGEWISRGYKKLSRLLCPEINEALSAQRKQRNALIDAAIKIFLEKNKCTCGHPLRQVRSGSKKLICTGCNSKYSVISKKQ